MARFATHFEPAPGTEMLVRVDDLDSGDKVWLDPVDWRQRKGDVEATEPMIEAAKEAWGVRGPRTLPNRQRIDREPTGRLAAGHDPARGQTSTAEVEPGRRGQQHPRNTAERPYRKAWVRARVNGRRHETCVPVERAHQLLERYARQGVRARAELIDGTAIGETVYQVRTRRWVAVHG